MLCRREAMGTGAKVLSSFTFTHLIVAGVGVMICIGSVLLFVSTGGAKRVAKGLERQGIAVQKPAAPAEPPPSEEPEEEEKSIQEVLQEKEAIKAARREVNVVFYTQNECPLCEQASAYLKEHDVFLDERNVSDSPEYAAEFAALSPKGHLPVIKVEEEAFVGWEPVRVEAAIDAAAKAHLPAAP